MKILYISNSSNWAGSCAALTNLLSVISKKHQVHVFLPCPKGDFCNKLDLMGISYTLSSKPYSDTVYPHRKNPFKYVYRLLLLFVQLVSARRDLKKLVVKFKPDIVHCNVGPLDISYSFCRKKNIPHVWHLREYQDLDFDMVFFPSKNKFMKKIHSEGNYNIAITNGVFNYWNLRPSIDRVIYDGVFSVKSSSGIHDSIREKFFLFVGRVSEAKGPHHILNVLRQVIDVYPDYSLKIAGDIYPKSQYHSFLLSLIEENKLDKHVVFLGNRKDIYDLMSKATALIVPSRFEGFGFITAEAMYNNCLVIGRNTGGTKEQFDNGLNDVGHEIALRFNDDKELKDCMMSAIRNDMSLLTESARAVVMSRYSIEVSAANVLAFYDQMYRKELD